MAHATNTAIETGRDATDKVRETIAESVIAKKAKEAAYTVVGLGIMGAQRASLATKQVAAHLGLDDASPKVDLDALRGRSEEAATIAKRQLARADEVVGGALARIEEAFAPLEVRLPDPARDTVSKAREVGRDLHAQLRTKLVAEPTSTEKSSSHKATKKAKPAAE